MARIPYPSTNGKDSASAGKPVPNILKLLSHSGATVKHWGAVGGAQFSQFALSKKNRELLVLLTTAKFGSAYEWTHHVALSAKVGVTDEQRQSLADAGKATGYFSNVKAGFTDTEILFLQFLESVIDTGDVSDDLLAQMRKAFSDREIVEIISMQACFAESALWLVLR